MWYKEGFQKYTEKPSERTFMNYAPIFTRPRKNIVTRIAPRYSFTYHLQLLNLIYSAEQYLIENYNLDRMPQKLEHK